MKRSFTLTALGLAFVAVLLFLATGAAETPRTGEIRGKITDDKTGAPVPFAIVTLEGTTYGAQADAKGEYLIQNVPPGSYRLCVSLSGWNETCVDKVTVLAGSTTTQNLTTVQKDPPAILRDQVGIVERFGEVHLRGGRLSETLPSISSHEYGSSAKALTRRPVTHSEQGYGTTYPPAHGGTTPPNNAAFDAMFFKHYGVNPFVSTEDDHLSTFAVDVDNGAYTMTRSHLMRGHLPPEEAVRVEEFVNNFKYRYPHPQSQPFTIDLEGAPSKFGDNYQLLKITIVGRKLQPQNRRDANLVFVVDVSGSMAREDRLDLVRRSLHMLVSQLTPRDRVGIVAFGSDAFTVLEPTTIRERERITAAIERLQPSGSTNAEAGLRLGFKMADRIFERGKLNRIILCSDGVANVGNTGAKEMLAQLKPYFDRGITLTTVGFGMGNYNDILMETLGNKGNGHYAYVDNWEQAQRVFVENLTGTLEVIARDVKVQVDFNRDQVDRYRLLGYENRDVDDDKFRDDTEDGGEIGSGHMVTALYEVKLKGRSRGDIATVFVRYKDPYSFEVSETAHKISRSVLKPTFESATTDFRLAAAAAEFAEILRGSYWARGSSLSDVLSVVRGIERERYDEQVIELVELIERAERINSQGAPPIVEEDEPFGVR